MPKSTVNAVARQLFREIVFTRWYWRLAMLATALTSALFGLLGPFLQKQFIDTLTGRGPMLAPDHPWMAPLADSSPGILLGLAFICILTSLACSQLVAFWAAREAIFVQRMWAERLYAKILNLRSDTLTSRPVGEIVAIYTTDLPGATILIEQSLPQFCNIIFPLTLAPFLIIALFDTPVLNTLLLMAGVVVLNLILANRQSRYFYLFKKLAADRIGLVNEWVQNLRTLRILGWVASFEKKIFRVRDVETKNRIAMLSNGQTMNAVASSITFILNLTLLWSLISSKGHQVTPGSLLALLWIVAIFLTKPFRQMPWFFTFLFDGTSSLQRAADLFAMENFEHNQRQSEFVKLQDLGTPDNALEIVNLNLKIGQQQILENISFTVKAGEFIAVVGEVGSGKSTLLLSLLGETGAQFAEYKVDRNNGREMPLEQLRQFYTYIPQEGFIMSSTLRENVAFEYDVDASKDVDITRALTQAQFSFVQERVKAGLDTEIGERGVNLSGGQKQRVSLARVDYYKAPIILLDDCLSAVDVDTENKIVEQLLLGSWKSRTRILATHRLSVLEKADRIFFLENGQLRAQGKFTDILQSSASFRDFTASLREKS